jgi:hypothetical protein
MKKLKADEISQILQTVGAEYSVFRFAMQKHTDEDIRNCNLLFFCVGVKHGRSYSRRDVG